MIRKSLFIAASAVALLAGAQAQASSISGTGIFSTVKSGTPSGAFKLAKELTYSTTVTSSVAATQAVATYAFQPTTAFTTGESLLLTIDLTGGVFTSTTGFSVSGTGNCTAGSAASVSPIAANGTSASYLVTLSGTCSGTANGLLISAPVQVTGATSSLVIGTKLEQSFGGQTIPVDGGRAAATFVTVAPAFSAAFSDETNNATATVSSGYRNLNTNGSAGSFSVSVDPNVSIALASSASASASQISDVTLTATAVTGAFVGYDLSYGEGTFGDADPASSTVRVINSEETAGSINFIDLADEDDAVIPASTFAVSAAVNLAAGLRDFTANGTIGSIVRDGTSFKAPWIALGATSANSTIRLANNGTTDTGPITMTLTSTNGGAATTKTVTISAAQVAAGSLNASGGIPAGGTVSISGAALKTAFGTTAANGDVEVTIEAQPQFISGKVRVTQASGQIFETSLGNLTDNRFPF